MLDKEDEWMKTEGARIREASHPATQPEDLECSGGSGMDELAQHINNGRLPVVGRHER